MCLRLVVDQDLAVVVENLREEDRFRVDTAVCDRGVGGSQFKVADTFCQSAESSCGVVISRGQRGDSEVIGVLDTDLRSHGFHQTANGNDVH